MGVGIGRGGEGRMKGGCGGETVGGGGEGAEKLASFIPF
jgi:hypothetical protein